MEPSLPSPDLLGLSPASPFGELNPLVLSNDTGTTPRRSPGSSQSSIEAESLPTNSGAIVPPVIGTGNGLLGQYYSGINFDTLQLTRTDPTINFNFGFGSPGGAIGADRFSIRWTGKLQPEYSETYTFYTNSDDGVRLWVNGQQLINNWTWHSASEDRGTITLVAGQTYDIKLDYFQNTGSSVSQLSWSSLSQTKEIIPQSQLYEPDLMLPTGNLLPPISTITNGSTANYQFSLLYDDKTGIRQSTIDNQDILVSGPNNFSQLAKLVSVNSEKDGSPLTATYSIEAPVGGWNANNSGIYAITLQANQVSDIDSNFIPNNVVGTFLVDFVTPAAKLDATNPVVGGSTSYRFSVIYSDNTLVAGGTIGNQDLQVSGPNNFSQLANLVSISPTRDSASMTAIYSIDAPNGVWDAKSSGTYTVTLRSNQVSDSSGNYVPRGDLGIFQVSLVPPTANLSETNAVIVGSTGYQFTVIYNDDTGVKQNTLDNQDILVTGPNTFSQFATLISVSSTQDGSPLTATYNLAAPGGLWDSADTGTYTITLQPNQITDLNGNVSPTSVLGSVAVDLTPPTASLTAPIVIVGQLNSTFTVVYSDGTAVNRSSLDSQDILVTGPNNFSQFATLISVSSTQDGSPLTATYNLAAPGDLWDSADTGAYTITLQPNQISDLDGNLSATTVLGTVAVDLTPPTASLTAPIVLGGQLNSTFTLVYSDNTAVTRSSIDAQDILVTGPNNFSQLATLSSVSSTQDGSPLTVTYNLAAPGDLWDSADTGTYTITLQPNQISDLDGNFIATTVLGTVAVDLTPPTANLTAPIVIVGQLNSTFTVVYSDTTAVTRSTIDSQDIRVTGPNNFSQLATVVSVSSAQDGSPLTVTYSITAPGGVWDVPDRGTYTIALQANQVSDQDGNFIAAGTLGTFLADETIYTGDFDGDGKVDILLRDLDSQKVSVFLIGGTTLKSQAFLPDMPANYTIADTTDRDGDGKADLLWQDAANQKVVLWSMDGTTLTSQAFLPELPIVAPIVNPIDFNGDGKADLLVRDPNNQKILISLMDGKTLISQAFLSDQASELRIVGTADFNGDGKTDILMQYVPNGMMAVWFVNGTKVTDILLID
jgi:PA14 domain/FG-GAP-like repeat